MNYQNVYDNIIAKAKYENRVKLVKFNVNYVYYERHHIIPKCMDGNNDGNNLVLLTAKEHYVCHKLLTYIYPGNRKIVLAFHYMTFNKRINRYIKSSRDYTYAKELISKTPVSKESKEKNKQKHLGKRYSSEINKKKGRPKEKHHLWQKHHKKESNEKNRQKHLGNTNSIGCIRSEKMKLSISNKIKNLPREECQHCHRMFQHSAIIQYHGDKCKSKII